MCVPDDPWTKLPAFPGIISQRIARLAVDIRELPSWSRNRFLAGANKYIQQESTFWRRGLWEKSWIAIE
jgi:hypothetical protein